jgi:alginate O-acetyltransferase complex protein AlgJ
VIYRHALHEAGVHFVDGPALMHAALGQFALDLYPRGGIHWNMSGAALAAQVVVAALDAQGAHLSPFTFIVARSGRPYDWDRDIADVLNLFYSDPYSVPVLSYQSQAPAQCQPERIVEVAGSFIFQMNDALEHTACPPEVRPYFYWTNLTTRAANGFLRKQPEDAARRRADILDWADIVILEENEATGSEAVHAQDLMAFMRPNPEARR